MASVGTATLLARLRSAEALGSTPVLCACPSLQAPALDCGALGTAGAGGVGAGAAGERQASMAVADPQSGTSPRD